MQEDPAVFRLPMSFVTINTGNGIRVDFANVSILGRLDFSLLNLSVDSIDVASHVRKSATDLRIEGNGLRIAWNEDGFLVNLDSIHNMYIPGYVQITEPVLGTVVRLRECRLFVKLNSIVGVKLKTHKSAPIELVDETIKEHPRKTKKTKQTKNRKTNALAKKKQKEKGKHPDRFSPGLIPSEDKDKIRRLIYDDIVMGLNHGRVTALKFKQMPVKLHVQNLRPYRNSFRGSEAVDYMMKIDPALSRTEAIEALRQLQVDLSKSIRACPFT
jgi:hypothetical protein